MGTKHDGLDGLDMSCVRCSDFKKDQRKRLPSLVSPPSSPREHQSNSSSLSIPLLSRPTSPHLLYHLAAELYPMPVAR